MRVNYMAVKVNVVTIDGGIHLLQDMRKQVRNRHFLSNIFFAIHRVEEMRQFTGNWKKIRRME